MFLLKSLAFPNGILPDGRTPWMGDDSKNRNQIVVGKG